MGVLFYMKKSLIKALVAASAATIVISCASTKSASQSDSDKKTGEAKVLKVINAENKEPVKKPDTPADIYSKKIQGITLSSESAPKETRASKAFASPFVFKAVKEDGSALQGLELTVNYPEAKTDGKISFGIASLTTDENGTVSFTSPVPTCSMDSEITVFPAGDVSDPEIAKKAAEVSVSVPYKVKTNKQMAGGIIAIVDFNASGKPITNNSVSSSNLLMSLMNNGFKAIGNADFTTAILQNDPAVVYKSAKTLLGNHSSYLIYGTVKYAAPIEKKPDTNKYQLTLSGELICLNMKDGSILTKTEKTVTVTEDKDWNCLPSARKLLAEAFTQTVLYGL